MATTAPNRTRWLARPKNPQFHPFGKYVIVGLKDHIVDGADVQLAKFLRLYQREKM